MSNKNYLWNHSQSNINHVFDKIDIDQFLFDSLQENIVINQNTKKRDKSPLSILMSPLRSEQNISQPHSYHQILQCSRQLPNPSYTQNDDKNHKGLQQATNICQKNKKNKLHAKNYREKKKQHLSKIQEENRFLKSKIDDLSFRLKQVEIQLNKYKHNHESNTKNYQTRRQSILIEIGNVLSRQEEDTKKLLQVKNELRKINGFDSKHRMDLLNYFMSELLQNLLNDMNFYFADSLIERKGIWKESDMVMSTRIDLEIEQIIGREQVKRIRQRVDGLPSVVMQHFVNFKVLWKELYKGYLDIINQGTLIQTLCGSLAEHQPSTLRAQVLNCLKLYQYFQKIKYRKDMRQLRESWFQQQQTEDKVNKKIKLIKE